MDCCWMKGTRGGGGMAVPAPRIYLEGARFPRARIQHLNDDGDADTDPKGGGEDDDDNNADCSPPRRTSTMLTPVFDGWKYPIK